MATSTKHSLSTTLLLVLLWGVPEAYGASIHSSQSGNWIDPATWVGSVVPGIADTVVVDNAHIITVNSAGSCAFLYVNAGNAETGVVLDTSGVLSVTGGVEVIAPTTNNSAYLDGCDGTVMIGGDIVLIGGPNGNRHAKLMIAGGASSVAGSIMMNNNRARVSFAGSGTLSVSGDLSGSGVLNPATGTVIFDGTVPQTIGAYTFSNITIANSSGVILGGNSSVNSALRFVTGNLVLGEYNLTLGPTAVIEGASSDAYVVTSGSGRLAQGVAQLPLEFPVGTTTSYNPVSVQVEHGTETISVAVEESVSPPIGDQAACVERTWVVAESVPGGNGVLGMTFQWVSSNEGSLFDRLTAVCWRNDGVNWVQDGGSVAVSGDNPYVAAVTNISADGRFTIGSPGAVTSVDPGEHPHGFALHQNYPNPFNPSTQVEFSVDRKGPVRLAVFNVLGQYVTTLFDGNAEPGRVYSVPFHADGLSSGIYLYELKSEGKVATRSMLYLR